MKKLSLFAAVIGIAAIMIGCDSKPDTKALTANEWQLEKVDANNSTSFAPKNVTIIFTDTASLFGRGGCNSFFGKFETPAANQIKIGPLGATMMLCLNSEFESDYFKKLEKVATFETKDNQLILKDADNTFTLTYKPKTEEEVVVEEEVLEGVTEAPGVEETPAEELETK